MPNCCGAAAAIVRPQAGCLSPGRTTSLNGDVSHAGALIRTTGHRCTTASAAVDVPPSLPRIFTESHRQASSPAPRIDGHRFRRTQPATPGTTPRLPTQRTTRRRRIAAAVAPTTWHVVNLACAYEALSIRRFAPRRRGGVAPGTELTSNWTTRFPGPPGVVGGEKSSSRHDRFISPDGNPLSRGADRVASGGMGRIEGGVMRQSSIGEAARSPAATSAGYIVATMISLDFQRQPLEWKPGAVEAASSASQDSLR